MLPVVALMQACLVGWPQRMKQQKWRCGGDGGGGGGGEGELKMPANPDR